MADQNLLDDDDFMLDEDLFATDSSPMPTGPKPVRSMSFFNQLPVQVTLELASAEMSLGELMRLGQGDVITLDRMVGEPLDIRVNGALLGRGEVVEVNGRYGVRLLEVEAGGVAAITE